jgi:hypothetical protein
MDIEIIKTIKVVDLCTPKMDINDISNGSVVLQKSSPSNTMMERIPNLHHRLPILPCYPKSNTQEQIDPLLPNMPRM